LARPGFSCGDAAVAGNDAVNEELRQTRRHPRALEFFRRRDINRLESTTIAHSAKPTNRATMSRWKAACIHLAISLTLASGIASLLYLLWFPPPYFTAAGATRLMLLIIGVDVVIGPALTLLVFNTNKPKRELRLDLSIIGVLQAFAFAYGLYVICQARPVFVVAAVDRLNVIAADELSDTDLAKGSAPEFRQRSWTGPRLVGANPSDVDVGTIVMQVAQSGKDIDQLPQYYVPYDQVAEALLKRAHPLTALKSVTSAQQAYLLQLDKQAKARGDVLVFVPLQSRKADFTAVISARSKRPLAVLAIDPWQATPSRPAKS
jgi:hypothetical protein